MRPFNFRRTIVTYMVAGIVLALVLHFLIAR
jgi:hypothetical protein